ncbi:BolA family protein [Temperatibacter marinus]|uniref:BolA family protein n=1 Tax=Temperatibacter marinus TaxID=1456591 RepID=A0AA52H9X0_9PROT|nr:BolA family protein [Temperatibacter marinus]WND03636.1 BolA family protein [Temperatibacter marinus]
MATSDHIELGPVGQKIVEKLSAALNPADLKVIDDSASHAGHAGNPDGDRESHFHVIIVSELFNGKGRVHCQRLVNAALKEEVRSGQIHALSMECTGTI